MDYSKKALETLANVLDTENTVNKTNMLIVNVHNQLRELIRDIGIERQEVLSETFKNALETLETLDMLADESIKTPTGQKLRKLQKQNIVRKVNRAYIAEQKDAYKEAKYQFKGVSFTVTARKIAVKKHYLERIISILETENLPVDETLKDDIRNAIENASNRKTAEDERRKTEYKHFLNGREKSELENAMHVAGVTFNKENAILFLKMKGETVKDAKKKIAELFAVNE